MTQDALAQAERLLAGIGIGATLTRAGHAHDVLVVHAAPGDLPALHEASPQLRALGFRYVTIEITRNDA